jgi:hypothetical protein
MKEEWMYSATILVLGTRWRWVVSFTPRPLYSRGKSPRYPLDRRLDGPQSRYGRCGGEKFLDLTENRTSTPRSSNPQPSHYTDWATGYEAVVMRFICVLRVPDTCWIGGWAHITSFWSCRRREKSQHRCRKSTHGRPLHWPLQLAVFVIKQEDTAATICTREKTSSNLDRINGTSDRIFVAIRVPWNRPGRFLPDSYLVTNYDHLPISFDVIGIYSFKIMLRNNIKMNLILEKVTVTQLVKKLPTF